MLDTLALSWRVANRHWQVYKKYFISNILPTVTEPIFFIFAFGIGLGAFVNEVDGMPYGSFMAPGLATSTALFTAFFTTSYNFYVRLTYDGVTHAILTTPVGPRELIVGEYIWVGLKSAMMTLGVSLVFFAFGLVQIRWLLVAPLVSILVGVACGGIGLFFTGLVKSLNQFQTVYSLIISPLFFFSAVFFPIHQFPRPVQWLAHLSPLYHGVIINQMLLWNKVEINRLLTHLGELILLTVILAYWGYRKILPKLRH